MCEGYATSAAAAEGGGVKPLRPLRSRYGHVECAVHTTIHPTDPARYTSLKDAPPPSCSVRVTPVTSVGTSYVRLRSLRPVRPLRPLRACSTRREVAMLQSIVANATLGTCSTTWLPHIASASDVQITITDGTNRVRVPTE